MEAHGNPVYLDYNATAPVRPQVVDAIAEVLRGAPANPSSVHAQGRSAKAALEKHRRSLAAALSCFPSELVFTASGSESNAMVLRDIGARSSAVAVCATEHVSVLRGAPDAQLLPVDAHGVLDMAALEQFLKNAGEGALVSVMLANNETGVLQDIPSIATLVHAHGGLLHCDAVQALGKIPLDLTLLRADFVSLSAHKCGGATGAAVLYVSQSRSIAPLIRGGGQEMGRRAGTENLAAIAGFVVAADCALRELDRMPALRHWLDALEAAAQAAFPSVRIVAGKGAARLPNTSSLRLPGVSSETQLMKCDLAGFAVSAGSACSSGRIESSHVLRAMWGEDAGADVIRISAGWATREEDILAFTEHWLKMAKASKAQS